MKRFILVLIAVVLLASNVDSQTNKGVKSSKKPNNNTEKVVADSTLIDSSAKTVPFKIETKKSVNKTKSFSVRVQCKATTKKGTRCKRMTTDPSGYCWQHK